MKSEKLPEMDGITLKLLKKWDGNVVKWLETGREIKRMTECPYCHCIKGKGASGTEDMSSYYTRKTV